MNSLHGIFHYTSDNAQMALDEIERILLSKGLVIKNVSLFSETRVCRNAYGKEVDEETFDSYDANEERNWFDDYDFVIEAEIYSDKLTSEELAEFLYENILEFECTKEEYIEELLSA